MKSPVKYSVLSPHTEVTSEIFHTISPHWITNRKISGVHTCWNTCWWSLSTLVLESHRSQGSCIVYMLVSVLTEAIVAFWTLHLNSEFQVKFDRISYMTKEVGHTTQLKVSVVQLLLWALVLEHKKTFTSAVIPVWVLSPVIPVWKYRLWIAFFKYV